LKAQNVFLTEGGLVKLGDFGVARVLEHTAAKARTVVGSPYYLSPEIIENRPYSFKTDIWSLGTLLYEMCALQPPFKANNLQFLALKIVQGAPPPLPKMYSE
jgi:NIMA (never in mitosis gene a)-related kinase 1/4/5